MKMSSNLNFGHFVRAKDSATSVILLLEACILGRGIFFRVHNINSMNLASRTVTNLHQNTSENVHA